MLLIIIISALTRRRARALNGLNNSDYNVSVLQSQVGSNVAPVCFQNGGHFNIGHLRVNEAMHVVDVGSHLLYAQWFSEDSLLIFAAQLGPDRLLTVIAAALRWHELRLSNLFHYCHAFLFVVARVVV